MSIILMLLTSCVSLNPRSEDLSGGRQKYEQKYVVGKDTVKAFGDAAFQIFEISDDDYALIMLPDNAAIERDIIEYREVGELLYIYGRTGYTIIDLDTNHIRQYQIFEGYTEDEATYRYRQETRYVEEGIIEIVQDFESFSEEEQAVFEELLQE
jgi:regulator of extracellular matrix RemA (YlzA/DUF370 family)